MVEFCIADTGIGLSQALAATHQPKHDADAICLALKVGVTSRSPNFGQAHMRNRGVGLSCIEKLVAANDGKFEIWSGRGRFLNHATSEHMTGNAHLMKQTWAGTLLTVSMSRNRLSADFRAVMQQLTQELRSAEAARDQERRTAGSAKEA